jgi:hypothetical protein
MNIAATAKKCCVSNSRTCIRPVCPHSRPLGKPQRKSGFRPLASHHVVSQRRNSIQGVQLFGRGGAHRSEVAIVAVAGRRISFFEFTLTPARASASSLCDLRVT